MGRIERNQSPVLENIQKNDVFDILKSFKPSQDDFLNLLKDLPNKTELGTAVLHIIDELCHQGRLNTNNEDELKGVIFFYLIIVNKHIADKTVNISSYLHDSPHIKTNLIKIEFSLTWAVPFLKIMKKDTSDVWNLSSAIHIARAMGFNDVASLQDMLSN